MAIKYQVFISSTYDDLRSEREQVLKAVLEMGHIPVGMEMFSAADEEQWKIITRQIDECDYYAVIVAHRYGTAVDGVSFTEMEYDYAVSKGIPAIGFVIENSAAWPADRLETDAEKKASLDAFKAKVKRKPVSFWTHEADLHGKFSISLMKQIASTKRPGWMRATDAVGPDVINELSRLSKENAELRQQLVAAIHQAEDDAVAERRRILHTMEKNQVRIAFFYDDGSDWEDGTTVTMARIFNLLAPEMMIEKSTEEIASYTGLMLRPEKERKLRATWPVPSNTVKHWVSDFITLGVCEPSQKRHTVHDTNEYWALTDKGRAVYTDMRRAQLLLGRADERDIPTPDEPEDAA